MEEIHTAFTDYVNTFCGEDGELHPLAVLKLNHSRRVGFEARGIACGMDWNAEDIALAEIAGILHDIGRFDQLRRFGTFADHKSVDHGEHGFEIIGETGLLELVPAAQQQAVLDSVRYHNRKAIPRRLSESSRRIVNLVRDADKLDILYIVSDTIQRQSYLEQPEILLEVEIDAPPSPELVQQVLENRSVSYSAVRSLCDFNLMRLAWVYDINYAQSLRRAKEKGHFRKIMEMLPESPEIAEIISQAENHLAGV